MFVQEEASYLKENKRTICLRRLRHILMTTQMNRSTQHTTRQTFSKSEPDNSKLVTNPRFQDRFCRSLVVLIFIITALVVLYCSMRFGDKRDGNWGEWNLSQVRWNWAQFSGPGLTFDLGDFIDNPNGRAAVDISGERIVFPESEYSIIHTKFAFDPVNKIEYPIQTVFRASVSTADHGTYGHMDRDLELRRMGDLIYCRVGKTLVNLRAHITFLLADIELADHITVQCIIIEE